MAVQARAIATRLRIIETAVELFNEFGYGETGLADILLRAKISKGAFYYHFESKESVAVAIIEEYGRRNTEAIMERMDLGAPLLDRVIMATFTSSAMLRMDATSLVGNELLQALGQVSTVACRIYAEWTEEFVRNLTAALKEFGRLDTEQAVEAAESMWAGVLGCHLLSSALKDDPYERLSHAWRSMLRAAVPETSLPHYFESLDQISATFRDIAQPAPRIRAHGRAASNS